ncbi:hypothetical protein AVKW3434_02400 [Acidovorax sp. SUPP3434]|uniref:hypothetical protein n=1 Tax=Acidovorax sp. SUPP3434 TaxID=2920880 RepID=UPI0023DE3290|nr:hypothetical protein [Acidovorax sp. SUPP3434]GKS98190.1 hypothetical protein AVKW3434_02400 [Acidovorax sp. SUPP3434]
MNIDSNLSTAQYALRRIKEEIYKKDNFKSSNKTSLRKSDALENARMQAAADEIDAIRAPRNVFNLKRALWEGRGHNCGELASAAKYIAAERGMAACVARTDAHGFAVIGDLPDPAGLPARMEQWPEHLAVCDPWVNVACQATAYPEKFMEKMQKWERDEKIIENPHSQTEEDGWIRPIDPAWTQAVLNGPRPESGD